MDLIKPPYNEYTNTMWMNDVPQFLRREFVKSTFPDIVWYDSDPDAYTEMAEHREGAPAQYKLVIRVRNCQIYIGTNCLDCSSRLDNRRWVTGPYGQIRVSDAGSACTWVSYYTTEYYLMWEETVGSWTSSVQCPGVMSKVCQGAQCRDCRRINWIKVGLRGIAEQIDVCVRDIHGQDILQGLEILRNRTSKFTFACIWWLKWRETGLPQVPRDVIKMILALM